MKSFDLRARRVSKDFAYSEIKRKIIIGELEPDQNVVEENLAGELEISRTPLREALQRLEMEGLIVRQSNGRLKVAAITRTEVEEVFVVRSMLEGIIARQAAENRSEKDVQFLTNTVEMIRKASEQQDEEDIIYYGGEFHSLLYEISGNKTAIKILSMLNDHIDRYRRLIPKNSKGRNGKATEEHARILQCIASKDADGAESAMREHILNSMSAAVERLN